MRQTRRQFIGRTAATATGASVLGGFGGVATAADESVPRVTTFGHFDDDTTLTGGNARTNYDAAGAVPGVEEPPVDDLAVVVHGWRPENDDAEAGGANDATFEEARSELVSSGYGGTVVGYEWDAHRGDSLDFGWTDAKSIADRNGPKLARFLLEYRRRQPRGSLRLLSHSLGTRVLVAGLQELRGSSAWIDCGFELTTVQPFGAAVDSVEPTTERPATHAAIDDIVGAAHNYHSRYDQVLRWAYETRELGSKALGRRGAAEDARTPANYADHDVTEAVGRDHSGYLERVSDLMVEHMR
ncbi:hypothetical protein ACNS7O_10075 [Haloferacaceae archaeon DSL9]